MVIFDYLLHYMRYELVLISYLLIYHLNHLFVNMNEDLQYQSSFHIFGRFSI